MRFYGTRTRILRWAGKCTDSRRAAAAGRRHLEFISGNCEYPVLIRHILCLEVIIYESQGIKLY